MQQITINGKGRVLGKKSDVKHLRKEGNVPCVLYGAGVENVIFSVTAKDLKLITHTPNSYIINLVIDGTSYLAVFHAIQYHPISDEALHVDFLPPPLPYRLRQIWHRDARVSLCIYRFLFPKVYL